MNYEKKYKEALEKARQFSERPLQEDSSGIVEYIFPELKESEDEKIRKALLESFEYQIKESHPDKEWVCGVKLKDIISWLEKQGGCEHIKKEWTTSDAATLKELIDFLENGTAKLQHDLTRYANWLKIQFTPIEKKSEQKSTWSEEDEEMFKSIMATCELAEQERDSSPARHLLEMQLNWLKSLKNRIKNGG